MIDPQETSHEQGTPATMVMEPEFR